MSIKFWENRKTKELNKTLFSAVAEEEAKKVQAKASATVNKPTQLRKFFDEIISFEARYSMAAGKTDSEEGRMQVFKQQLPFAHMLVPKAKYAEARKLVSSEFVELIRSAILDNLEEPDDIRILKSFFEAFTGYFKYFNEMEKVQNSYNQGGRR